MAEAEKGAKRKLTPLYWLGFVLLVLGATLTGNFVAKQVRDSDQGHTYFEFIGGGIVVALIGIVVIGLALRRGRTQVAEPGAAADPARDIGSGSS
jgi:hypothetical protein